MKHYLLFYEVADDYVARRARFRSEHLAKAWAASRRGELLLGGAFADPADGAVLLFAGESRAVAEDFARTDPYVTGGAVKRWHVREWNTVVGDAACAPVRPDFDSDSAPSSSAPTDRPAVLRLWRGRATAAKAGEYLRHVKEKVLPKLESIPGHRGVCLLQRSVESGIEYVVLTLWASMDAVRSFAGSEPDKAVVEPEARAALSEFDPTVTHYEIVVDTREPAPRGR
jgi:heme-degrading monooxygenase HmoA/uncharacterized protein YciI